MKWTVWLRAVVSSLSLDVHVRVTKSSGCDSSVLVEGSLHGRKAHQGKKSGRVNLRRVEGRRGERFSGYRSKRPLHLLIMALPANSLSPRSLAWPLLTYGKGFFVV